MNATAILAALPTADTVRWTPKKKAAVIAALNAELMSDADALALYNISAGELAGWRASVAIGGTPALRVTRIQFYPRAA